MWIVTRPDQQVAPEQAEERERRDNGSLNVFTYCHQCLVKFRNQMGGWGDHFTPLCSFYSICFINKISRAQLSADLLTAGWVNRSSPGDELSLSTLRRLSSYRHVNATVPNEIASSSLGLAAGLPGRVLGWKQSFAPCTAGAKDDFVFPSVSKHGKCQHGPTRIVQDNGCEWAHLQLLIPSF